MQLKFVNACQIHTKTAITLCDGGLVFWFEFLPDLIALLCLVNAVSELSGPFKVFTFNGHEQFLF